MYSFFLLWWTNQGNQVMSTRSLQCQPLFLQDTSASWSASFCRFSAHDRSAWLLKLWVLFLNKMLLLTIMLTMQCNYGDFPITNRHVPFPMALDISGLLPEKTLFLPCVDYIHTLHKSFSSHLCSRVGAAILDSFPSQLKVPDQPLPGR